ncbi:MAG: response regulator [Verrucomicrobiaceae bacterium]|nr:MAG: response regulator [Verrucomicrobiaceae bacterium]
MSTEPVTIILAEDDDGHASLVQRNLERAGLLNGFARVRDGQELLDCLTARKRLDGLPLGDELVILLDINMPRIDGIEALRQIKANPETQRIPVIMLTATDDPREVNRCYELGCNVYVTKPVDYEGFIDAIRRLGMFLQVVKRPQSGWRSE